MNLSLLLRAVVASSCVLLSGQSVAQETTMRFTESEGADTPASDDDPAPRFIPPASNNLELPPASPVVQQAPSAAAQRAALPTPPAQRRVGTPTPVYLSPANDPSLTSQTRRALGFYGGSAARATLSQMPSRSSTAPRAQAQAAPAIGKPFNSAQTEPTLSPYLNLYRERESSVSVPSYYTWVQPQQERQDANRKLQRQMHRVRGQVNVAAANGSPANAYYMNTGQYYGSLRR